MGIGLSGEFIGFTFNNVHSSTLGLIRVSDGSRYNEDLLPAYQDKVVDAPGTDESYYFGSYYKQKVINISVAFDGISEIQIRKIKQLFGDKEVHELWFDETPYKAYTAKVNGNPNLKYICFNRYDINGYIERVYKGEGTLSFIAYYPFAHNRYKYLEDYGVNYPNSEEWATASKLRLKQNYNQLLPIPNYEHKKLVKLWNAGDIESDFKINIDFNTKNEITAGQIAAASNSKVGLNFSQILKQGNDTGIQINSRLKIIQGYTKDSKGKIQISSNIYNKHILSGDFFKIPLGESEIIITNLEGQSFEIDYQYWYL